MFKQTADTTTKDYLFLLSSKALFFNLLTSLRFFTLTFLADPWLLEAFGGLYSCDQLHRRA